MILSIDGVTYKLYRPSNEDELENEVKEHAKDLFGEDCLLFDKQRMKSVAGIGTVPDIFVLSLPDKWYIVEVELSTHPVYDHIVAQVTKFMNAYGNPQTKERIRDSFYKTIKESKVTEAKVKECIGSDSEEIHKSLSDLISHPPTLVIVIEERTKELEEACQTLAWQPKIVEFKTFRREDAATVHAHLFEPVVEIKPPQPAGNHRVVITPTPIGEKGEKEQAGETKVEIQLANLYSPRKWGFIPLSPKDRPFFPGYKIDFVLQTDIGEIRPRVTSAPAGTQIGDPKGGRIIQGGLKPWYEAHPELKNGDILVIEAVEPKKRYKLTVKH